VTAWTFGEARRSLALNLGLRWTSVGGAIEKLQIDETAASALSQKRPMARTINGSKNKGIMFYRFLFLLAQFGLSGS
jgi:hypothetical protein